MQLGLVTTLDITVGNLHVRQNYGKFACATEIMSNIIKNGGNIQVFVIWLTQPPVFHFCGNQSSVILY